MAAIPKSVDTTVKLLAEADYVAERSLATSVYLALKLGRPLFLEGEAGVGKTEIAKVLSQTLDRKDRKSTRLNSSHVALSRMPSSA